MGIKRPSEDDDDEVDWNDECLDEKSTNQSLPMYSQLNPTPVMMMLMVRMNMTGIVRMIKVNKKMVMRGGKYRSLPILD